MSSCLSGAIHRHFESLKRSNHEATATGEALDNVKLVKKRRSICSKRHRVSVSVKLKKYLFECC